MMRIRGRLKKFIPERFLNGLLLRNPWLYSTRLIRFEANLLPRQLAVVRRELAKCVFLDGDVIECGSSRCGTSVQMARWAPDKTIYALDSFQGFSRLDVEHDERLGSIIPPRAFTSTSYEYVRQKVRKLGSRNVVIVPGFFEDTLAHWQRQLCFALIDCDLELPVRYCLARLLPWMAPGGIIVIDDYDSGRYLGAKIASDQFVRENPSAVRVVTHEYGMLAIQRMPTSSLEQASAGARQTR